MNKIIIAGLFISLNVFAGAEKVDWKACENEINEFCTTSVSDQEKHECLEEAPKSKISKACSEYNKSIEKQFKDKHDHKKGNSH